MDDISSMHSDMLQFGASTKKRKKRSRTLSSVSGISGLSSADGSESSSEMEAISENDQEIKEILRRNS